MPSIAMLTDPYATRPVKITETNVVDDAVRAARSAAEPAATNLVGNSGPTILGISGASGFVGAGGNAWSDPNGGQVTVTLVADTSLLGPKICRAITPGVGGGEGMMVQYIAVPANVQHCGSIYLKATAGSTLILQINWNDNTDTLISSSFSASFNATGWWERKFVTGTAPAGTVHCDLFVLTVPTLATTIDTACAQLEAAATPSAYIPTTGGVTGSRAASSGLLPGDGSLNVGTLGVFDAATNLCLQANHLAAAAWTNGGVTVTENCAVGPTGILDANLISTAGGVGFYQDITVSASTAYTWSWWGKLGTKANLHYRIVDVTHAADIKADTTAALNSSTYTKVLDTFTTPVGCVSVRIVLLNGGADAGTFYIWRNMFEAGSLATPPVDTTTVSATRPAALVQFPVDPRIFTNRQGGIIACTTTAWSTAPNNGPRLFEWSNGAGDFLLALQGATALTIQNDASGGAAAQSQTSNYTAPGTHLFCAGWQPADIYVASDGVALVRLGSRTETPVITGSTFAIGASAFVGGRALGGYLRWFATYSGVLTDADSARLAAAFGQSTSPKPSFRAIANLVPGAHITALIDCRTGTGQRRVAA